MWRPVRTPAGHQKTLTRLLHEPVHEGDRVERERSFTGHRDLLLTLRPGLIGSGLKTSPPAAFREQIQNITFQPH